MSERPEEAGGTAPEAGRERLPRPWMTLSLMIVLVLIWLIMTVQGGSLDATTGNGDLLIAWGAAGRPGLFVDRQLWRLVTANFVHFGLTHLAVNVFSLWVVGRAIEVLYGPWRLLYLFLVSGVIGAAASALLGAPVVTSAGASGAIFGLLGAIVWFRLSSPLGELVLWKPLLLTLGLNLGIGLTLYRYVDNWDHIGGLVGGFVAAAAMGVPLVAGWRKPRLHLGLRWHRPLTVLLLAAVALLPLGVVPLPGAGYRLAGALEADEAGRLAEAEEGYRAAIRRQGDVPGIHDALIRVYLREGKCTEAREVYSYLARLAPEYPNLALLRSYVLRCK